MQNKFCKIFVLITLFCSQSFATTLDNYQNGDPIVVPKGNAGDPPKFEKKAKLGKFKGILEQLTQENYGCVIRQAAEYYNIDPMNILASIIGEHTFNVDHWDVWGENYLFMRKRWIKRFKSNGINLADMLDEPKFLACVEETDNNYDLWLCYNQQWESDKRNPKGKGIKWAFFNPIGSGYTYGLGQLGPVRALMVSDVVNQTSNYELLSIDDPQQIYDHILNPQTSIHYVAATNRLAINIYKELANFDISQNSGVVATLYNTGNEVKKAEEKYQANVNSLSQNKELVYPRSNHYGWFINTKENEIRRAYNRKIKDLSDEECLEHLVRTGL